MPDGPCDRPKLLAVNGAPVELQTGHLLLGQPDAHDHVEKLDGHPRDRKPVELLVQRGVGQNDAEDEHR